MKILLLGSTGLLGRNVLNKLMNDGHDVVALVRNSHGIREIHSDKTTIIEGSLTNIDSLRKAAEGCHAIINCAGTTDMSLLRYEEYLPINADLCRKMALIAETTDTKTIVHVSSANTIGSGSKECPATEDEPMHEPFASSMYARSKREGERHLEEAAARLPDCHIVILNPGFMIGAWDTKPSSGQLLLAGYRKLIMAVPAGGKSFVAVSDVAAATVTALTKGRSGERYLITGEEMSLKELYRRQAARCGYRQRQLVLPQWLVAAAGRVGDMLRHLQLPTQLSTNNVRQLSATEHYSAYKAAVELCFKPSSIDDAIADFFEWRKTTKS